MITANEEQRKALVNFIHKAKFTDFTKGQLDNFKEYVLTEICETVRHNMSKKQLNKYIDIILNHTEE